MSDDEDVNQLRAKLQEQAAEFESYKQECRNIEQMLEQDCQKKDDEIRQLKQDAIRKQKGEKMLKTQFSQLQAQVQNLKAQLGESTKTESNSAAHKQEIDKLTKQNSQLKEKNRLVQEKLQAQTTITIQIESQIKESNMKVQQLTKQLQEAQNRPPAVISAPSSKQPAVNVSKYEQEIKKLKQKLASLEKQKTKFEKLSKQRESQIEKIRHDYDEKIRKLNDSHSKQRQQKPKRQFSQPKEPRQTISLTEHKLQIAKLKQTIHQLQQRNQKHENIQKDLRQKLNALMSEKQNLLQKNKNLQKQLQRERQRRQQMAMNESPQKQAHEEIFIEQSRVNHLQQQFSSIRMDCLLLTKRHYISPFIEIKDGKLIKVYKSTKNGFEKSLGATKHKFDSVGYDAESIVQNGSNFAKDSIERGTSHSIVLYGSKRTSKKYLMAALVRDLKQWILQKVDQNSGSAQQQQEDQNQPGQGQVHCMYMKRSADEQRNYLKQSTGNRQQIQQILQEIISMGAPSSPNKSQVKNKNKKNQKPKVRYFSITFSQGLTLQIISTSCLNPFIKNNETFTDYINTVVFNKLPNILQSAITNFHIITTINPIVNLYEECKNTLSITLVPFKETTQMSQMDSRFAFSPQGINKDDLNDLTKKRLQNFQKETEQFSLKARKIEDQCNYLRSRFEQLQIRLKNLINTHQQQNTYLKKSPVTLSYEKLLKFVNSVLSRNTTSSRGTIQPNFGQTASEEYQNQLEMYIQEDAKSLDGY